MICRECYSEMYLDDTDYNYKGNYDQYWCCKSCQTSCIKEVRGGSLNRELWHSENDNKVKDYVVL